MMIKGYNNSIGFSDLHPARFNLISVPLKGAKFLTGMKLIMAHLADNITAPSPLWLALKSKGTVICDEIGASLVEPIIY